MHLAGGATVWSFRSSGTLVATTSGDKIMLTDEKGGIASVTIVDVNQSNGVIHAIDHGLLPK